MIGVGFLFAMVAGKNWLESLQAAPPFHYTVDNLLTTLGWASQVPTVVVLTRAYHRDWPHAEVFA